MRKAYQKVFFSSSGMLSKRRELERWIDKAISLLDAMDGDVDLEDDGRENIDERELETDTWR